MALTDVAIERIARDNYLVVTADLKLVHHLEGEGVAAINFNHLRQLTWQ